ncbi:fibrobacter succinogenes major paralogous domain-containing protein [Flavobacterium okayamense]|uniref:Major paralogous domain-containing protein n=1 Tax=Flavobacterium okayamense TaxID=2830782 RepID=A0ABM7S4X1_9FLAO|nr:fibrobacter succinogenes major paralogous domain-containing protein [Flavobacterium okayamense]BCY28571.1 hypothetical protein KK2020170_14390 [Flavobacterium okayamense]
MNKLLFYTLLIVNTVFSQNIEIKNSSTSFIKLNQEQIDSIKNAEDGYMVFNTTTGCINYFFTNKWFALCGECTPKARLPKIDSIIQKNNLVKIYYSDLVKGSTQFKIENWKMSNESPYISNIPSNTSSLTISIKKTTSCGSIDSTFNFKVKEYKVSPIEIIKINNKPIKTRLIGKTRWMCEDYAVNIAVKDIFKNCPEGWRIPNNRDWEDLLVNYLENYEELFNKNNDYNTSISLNKNGVYSIKDKVLIAKNESGYYLTNDHYDSKQGILIISENGHSIAYEKQSLFLISVRYIKDE